MNSKEPESLTSPAAQAKVIQFFCFLKIIEAFRLERLATLLFAIHKFDVCMFERKKKPLFHQPLEPAKETKCIKYRKWGEFTGGTTILGSQGQCTHNALPC